MKITIPDNEFYKSDWGKPIRKKTLDRVLKDVPTLSVNSLKNAKYLENIEFGENVVKLTYIAEDGAEKTLNLAEHDVPTETPQVNVEHSTNETPAYEVRDTSLRMSNVHTNMFTMGNATLHAQRFDVDIDFATHLDAGAYKEVTVYRKNESSVVVITGISFSASGDDVRLVSTAKTSTNDLDGSDIKFTFTNMSNTDYVSHNIILHVLVTWIE